MFELTMPQMLAVSVMVTVRNLSFKDRHNEILFIFFCPFKIKQNKTCKHILNVSQ